MALETTPQIRPESLTQQIRGNGKGKMDFPVTLPNEGVNLENNLEKLRAQFMLEALERSDGVQSKAAELLGMSFRSFRYFAKKYDLFGDPETRAEM